MESVSESVSYPHLDIASYFCKLQVHCAHARTVYICRVPHFLLFCLVFHQPLLMFSFLSLSDSFSSLYLSSFLTMSSLFSFLYLYFVLFSLSLPLLSSPFSYSILLLGRYVTPQTSVLSWHRPPPAAVQCMKPSHMT
jgi:hypothetical protein